MVRKFEKGYTLTKILRAMVVVLLAAGLLGIAQHHHDDFGEHDDCPVCALVQGGLDICDDTPQVSVFWVILFALVGEGCSRLAGTHFRFYRPRGPPFLA